MIGPRAHTIGPFFAFGTVVHALVGLGAAAPTGRLVVVGPESAPARGSNSVLQERIEKAIKAAEPQLEVFSYRALLDALFEDPAQSIQQPGINTLALSMRAAMEAYLEHEFAAMRKILQNAENAALNELASGKHRVHAGHLNRLLGVANSLLGDTEQAQQRFILALRLDPQTSLNDRVFAPSLVAEFVRAQTRLRAETQRVATIESTPLADLLIDGDLVGETPRQTQLGSGLHYLSLQRLGFRPVSRLLRVGSSIALNETLTALGKEAASAQAREQIASGDLDLSHARHRRDLARIRGATWSLSWRMTESRALEAVLATVDPPRDVGTATVTIDRLEHLWSALTRRSRIEPTAPFWQRAWFWGMVGGVVVASAGGVAGWYWATSREPTVVAIQVGPPP